MQFPAIGMQLKVWVPREASRRLAFESSQSQVLHALGYQKIFWPQISATPSEGLCRNPEGSSLPEIVDPESKERFYLRSSVCMFHDRVFACIPRSYKDLPFRVYEIGDVYFVRDHHMATSESCIFIHCFILEDQANKEVDKLAGIGCIRIHREENRDIVCCGPSGSDVDVTTIHGQIPILEV